MKKDFYVKIIKEEIGNFDFLGSDGYEKEMEINNLLKNEDFQKQFICDSLLSINDNKKTERNSKIKLKVVDSIVGGNWEEDFDDASYISLDCSFDVEYQYVQSKEPAKFSLFFTSDKIAIDKGGYYDRGRLGGTPDTDIEPYGEAYYSYLDWTDINVNLYTVDGSEIEFTSFRKAPVNIRILFIKEYTEDIITDKTMGIEDNSREFKNLTTTGYC